MQNPLTPNGLFDTPTTAADLQDWLMRLSGSERTVALTAAGMTWNLASHLVDNEIQKSYNTDTVNN